jgi:putative aminopeptidase FrvX
MASAVATDRISVRRKMLMFYHAPADAATEQSVKAGASTTTWQAMAGYGSFQVAAMTALKAGNGMIELSIYAATDSSGTNATEIKTSGVIAADTVGDWAMQECTAEEVNQIGRAASRAFTHVAAYIDCHHNDDECAVVYVLDEPQFKYDGLTPATTLA